MRILITGASGYLGGELVSRLSTTHQVKGLQKSSNYKNFENVDVLNFAQIESVVKNFCPSIIIHCAAMIDNCDVQQKKAFEINVLGTRNLCNLANKFSIPMVFISSASVFDGKRGTFKESDTPSPRTMYGITKLKGEKLIQALKVPYLIIRPSLLVGLVSSRSHKFFPRTVRNLLENKVSHLDTSWRFTPTSIDHIHKVINWWEKSLTQELLHISVPKEVTKHELIKDIAKTLCFSEKLLIPQKNELAENPLNLLQSDVVNNFHIPTLTYQQLKAQLASEINLYMCNFK